VLALKVERSLLNEKLEYNDKLSFSYINNYITVIIKKETIYKNDE
jgi:hypothetical protein